MRNRGPAFQSDPLFDLGERSKVAVFSVTEGGDKPLKYPYMFRTAELILLNKIDLLPHLDFDLEKAISNVMAVNPRATVIRLSARTGEGLNLWCDWLRVQSNSVKSSLEPRSVESADIHHEADATDQRATFTDFVG